MRPTYRYRLWATYVPHSTLAFKPEYIFLMNFTFYGDQILFVKCNPDDSQQTTAKYGIKSISALMFSRMATSSIK